MTTTTQLMKRLALFAAATAIVTMAFLTLGRIDAQGRVGEPALPARPLANHAGVPLAPGDSGGEVTRGNQSGSFAPTSTNDLVTPWTPTPGSPWRD